MQNRYFARQSTVHSFRKGDVAPLTSSNILEECGHPLFCNSQLATIVQKLLFYTIHVCYIKMHLRSRSKITFTFPQFSRMLLCLPICYIPSGMRLIGKLQNHLGIFYGTCQVYLFTTPYNIMVIKVNCKRIFSAK
jgi:hypothetical protein